MIKLEDYDYELPKDRIAQYPAERRDQSKLLILEKDTIKHRQFYQILDEIKKGDVIVVNNSKVVASNVKGKKETGGTLELLFLGEADHARNEWNCLIKGRKLKIGGKIYLASGELIGTIVKWVKRGQFVVGFPTDVSIREFLDEHASIALPPYIKAVQEDISRYQTIYASKDGSIAAPTAGFHFTKELIRKLEGKGSKFVQITLHVGYSTFMPLENGNFSTHSMDSERFSLSNETAEVIEACQNENNQLIVVGTTTLKALESATNNKGAIDKFQGWSDLFIAPGYSFKTNFSKMVTNFHLPKSSPLLMVCAFAGKERILRAYREAVLQNYRFYSFGDAMLIKSK